MLRLILGTASTLLIIFIIPILVYGALAGILNMKTPEGVSPLRFLLGTLVSKIGTAILIAFIFFFAKDVFFDNWILFTAIIFAMFVFGEIGQSLGPNYSWKEALSGILSEAIYLPLSVLVLRLIFK